MRKLTRPAAVLGYVAAAVLVFGGSIAVSQAAGAVAAIDNGEPGMLVLEADPSLMVDNEMQPGDTLYWPVATQLEVAQVGSLELTIEHAGALASTNGGLRLSVQKCAEPWEPTAVPTCAAGADLVIDRGLSALPSGSTYGLGSIAQLDGPYFLLTLALPQSVPNTLQGTSATIALGFTAAGDNTSVTVPLDGGLPKTGIDLAAPLLLGVGLVLGGLVFARQRLGRAGRGGMHSGVRS